MKTITKDFVTAGNATFTLSLPEQYGVEQGLRGHYTFKCRFKEGQNGFKDTYFVSLLTGPDNYSNYTYLGMLDPVTGVVRTTAKSCMNGESLPVRLLNRALQLVWENNPEPLVNAGFNLLHEGKCGRCGRKLTVPESIESGIGPECASRIAA
jgi:hypothetical protein